MNKKISQLRKFFNEQCKLGDKLLIKRKRKLSTKTILYFLFKITSENSSYTLTNSILKIDNIVFTSKQSISHKLNNINSDFFDKLRINLIKHISASNILSQNKIYAIDGSKLSFSKELSKEGFKLTKNKHYCKALLSTLYDVTNKLPIKCSIDSHGNERKSVIEKLLPEIPKHSIVLFDAGYYSDYLVTELNKKEIKYIIRMKKSSLLVKHMKEHNIEDYTNTTNKYGTLRVVRYIIDNKHYYLGTNIYQKNVNYFKKLYHERWTVEEYYKTIKSHLKSNNFNCKSLNKNKQQLISQVIITIIARYLEHLTKKYNKRIVNTKINNIHKGNYQINHKNTLSILSYKLLHILLFKKSIKNIVDMLGIINDAVIYIIPNRKCKRIRIKPVSKWYYLGLSVK